MHLTPGFPIDVFEYTTIAWTQATLSPKKSKTQPSLVANAGGSAAGGGFLFQQHVAAWFAAWILTDSVVDPRLNLPGVHPEWVKCEAESPVDDVFVKTSDGGFIASQAKRSLSLSSSLTSEFGKAIDQFVRHWYACRIGDGKRQWDRALERSRDRLALIVSPSATKDVREHLPKALAAQQVPGGRPLTQKQTEAFKKFNACVQAAWANLATSPMPNELLPELYALVRVVVFNPDDSITEALLRSIATSSEKAHVITSTLTTICAKFIADRDGADLNQLRDALHMRGIALKARPTYQQDVERLVKNTAKVNRDLQSYQSVAIDDQRVTIERECQAAIKAAALTGPLLIVGEPGVGKSGIINTLAAHLKVDGKDVIQLSVDEYSVESLEGLTRDLKLDLPILDVLDAWSAPESGWILIDALDASRGGHTETVFRKLIEETFKRKNRWRIVASIRTFDLELGHKYKSLFVGQPPDKSLSDPRFGHTRHIAIPGWTDTEMDQLLSKVPKLRNLLDSSDPSLRTLAKSPFATKILCDLISTAWTPTSNSAIATLTELLRTYWSERVRQQPFGTEDFLHVIVEQMVSTRSLKLSRSAVRPEHLPRLEGLFHQHVLVEQKDDDTVSFNHHLLFDYAASQVYLKPKARLAGRVMYDKSKAIGLMLATAMTFALEDLWSKQSNRRDFWLVVTKLLSEDSNDPIFRSVASRSAAEFPRMGEDLDELAKLVAEKSEAAVQAVSHVVGALVIHAEDHQGLSLRPWVNVATALSTILSHIDEAEWSLRVLCHHLVVAARSDDEAFDAIGAASRKLLAWAFDQRNKPLTVGAAIGFVADTFRSDARASRQLLTRIFSAERFDSFGDNEIPAITRKIESIADADPSFVPEIYDQTFNKRITDERETTLGNSRILPLRSNARQDYEMSMYALAQFFPKFLVQHPLLATKTLRKVVDGFVEREHEISSGRMSKSFSVDGTAYVLQQDFSYIWATDPDPHYAKDGDKLLAAFVKALVSAEIQVALEMANDVMRHATYAIYWSRLFMVGAQRRDAMSDRLWAYATCETLLIANDTRKEALKLIAAIYSRRSVEERQAFEDSVFKFDYSDFQQPELVRDHIEKLIFATIGSSQLVSERARIVADHIDADESITNERTITSNFATRVIDEDYFWIENLDRGAPANAILMAAIADAKTYIGSGTPQTDDKAELPSVAIGKLLKLETARNASDVDPRLMRYAIDLLGDLVERLVMQNVLHGALNASDVDNLVGLIVIAMSADRPEVTDKSDADFEQSTSWGGPAGRVSAAKAAFDVVLQLPETYGRLKPIQTAALHDPHPAVRLCAAERICRFWDLERERVWDLTASILAMETNASVLDHFLCSFVNRLLNADPIRVQALLLSTLERIGANTVRYGRLKAHVIQLLAQAWSHYSLDEAHSTLQRMIADVRYYALLLQDLCHVLRGDLIVGLRPSDNGDPQIRKRAQDLFRAMIKAANEVLTEYFAHPTDGTKASATACMRLVDDMCMQLFFASGGSAANAHEQLAQPDGVDQRAFFEETKDILKDIATVAESHAAYYLLQIYERQIDVADDEVFDLIAFVLLERGPHIGFQFEQLGADLAVRLIRLYLTDHKHVFNDVARRTALIDCLEVFIAAGWPSARRLLYRLPDLVQ